MADFARQLCSAAEAGDSLVVRKLLRRLPNIDVNSRGRETYGHSALSKAAKNGHADVVRLLLEAGADANVHDALLVTPLHLAARGGHTEVIRLLLHYGAKVDAKTKDGMIPIDFADYESESWRVIYTAEYGILPELPPQADVVPVIPWYALQTSSDTDNKGKIDKKKGQTDVQNKIRK